MAELRIQVDGLDEVLRKAQPDHLIGPPLKEFFSGATLAVKGEAMATVPVDTAHLQRSHATEVDSGAIPLWGKVGTNVPYGIYVHEGTRPHLPPVAALGGWAGRHGMNARALAYAIAKKGTKANPWLKKAFETSKGKIDGLVAKAAAAIEAQWGK